MENSIKAVFKSASVEYWRILEINERTRDAIRLRELKLKAFLEQGSRNEFEPPLKDRFLFLGSSNQPIKTIVSIAVPYDAVGSADPGVSGHVDNFAWGVDYHRVLKNMLSEINDGLTRLIGSPHLSPEICVDTSAYIDREIGLYTGLGKIGKNHFLIHPKLGTQFFIGYLIYREALNLGSSDIDLDHILYEGCDDCGRCRVACPAQICGFKEMESDRCISSLTQTKGTLTDAEKTLIGNRLYGCNICQVVCPSNNQVLAHDAFVHSSKNQVDLKELLNDSNKAFKRKYGQMGFSWRPAWIYKRNALIVMGNRGDLETLEWLEKYCESGIEESLKFHCLWAIDTIKKRIDGFI